MINLKSDKNQKTNETRLVQILFYTFPLWFIVGNLAVSINTLLFIVASLFLNPPYFQQSTAQRY